MLKNQTLKTSPALRQKKKKLQKFVLPLSLSISLCIVTIVTVALAVPLLLATNIRHTAPVHGQFPVTVDPVHKTITEDARVDAFFDTYTPPAQSTDQTENIFWKVVTWIATTVGNTGWYQDVAAVDGRLITITPGMRKEQVASTFAKTLGWNKKQARDFITTTASSSLPLFEGSFSPGVYFVSVGTTPSEAQTIVNTRFSEDVLAHYGPTIEKRIPLQEALTIASLIERETLETSDMRLVSGIIWNRLFAHMNLQIDATVQYAKASDTTIANWWPKIFPADLSRRSLYNTYLNDGLPPTPIANPSVAAIVAALNPLKTSCLFYFNDQAGNILCTDTYAQHVALLKKYYGQGK